MLVGYYEHKIDSAHRTFIPAKFREYFPDGFYYQINLSDIPSIRCFSRETYERDIERALEEAMDQYEEMEIKANMTHRLCECTYDKLGRVIFDTKSLKDAGIGEKCIFQGCYDYFEIYSPENFEEKSKYVASERKKDMEASRKQREKFRQLKSEGAFIKYPGNPEK